jgi:hypothetical protein
MSRNGREDEFERIMKAALSVDAPPHLAARLSEAVRLRRERTEFWRIFSPLRVALIGSLSTAVGVVLGIFVPMITMSDSNALLAAAFSGGFS